MMHDGYHTIDPDGPDGVLPFTVHCIGYTTHIYITPGGLFYTVFFPSDLDPLRPHSIFFSVLNWEMHERNVFYLENEGMIFTEQAPE